MSDFALDRHNGVALGNRLPVLNQLSIGIVTVVCILVGAYFELPWVVVPGVVILILAIIALSNPFVALTVYSLAILIVPLQPDRFGKASTLDVLAGIVMLTIAAFWFFRTRIIEWQPFSLCRNHFLMIVYFGWTIIVGIGGMLFYNNAPNDWLRELLLQLPIVLTPFLYVLSVERSERRDRQIMIANLFTWIVYCLYNIYTFRQHVLKAYYLYQTGRGTFSPDAAALMLFACCSFYVILQTKSQRIIAYVLALFACATLAISAYRTVWIACVVACILMYFLLSREDRAGMRRFYFRLSSGLLAAVLILSARFRLIRLFIVSYISRLASSTHVTTDLSLVNRYIEWRRLLQFVFWNPLVGYGFGARYLDYDWLLGYSSWQGYTHNGYLWILFRAGAIGAPFFFVSFFVIGIRSFVLSSSKVLAPYERAVMRVLVALCIIDLLSALTLNVFSSRTNLLWLGMGWGALIIYDRKHRSAKRTIPPNTSVVNNYTSL